MPLPFARIVPFPGPFSQDRVYVNIEDGMPGSTMVSAILIRLVNKFGKSLTFMQRSFHPYHLVKW